MEKLAYILVSLLTVISIIICIGFIEIINNNTYVYRYEYEINGIKGIAATCYEVENGDKICRDTRHKFQVDAFHQIKIPR